MVSRNADLTENEKVNISDSLTMKMWALKRVSLLNYCIIKYRKDTSIHKLLNTAGFSIYLKKKHF